MVSPSSVLLAQASTEAGKGRVETETPAPTAPTTGPLTAAAEKVTTGQDRDGMFSSVSGFLSPFDLAESLPDDFTSWELAARRLPHLLRRGTVHNAVAALPSLQDKVHSLPDRFLPRAAIVISSLLHSFAFEARNLELDEQHASLPDELLTSWDLIASRLDRPWGIRTIADDLLNNVRTCGKSRGLSLEYFDIPEERTSGGLQVEMENVFAPALETITNVQSCIRTEDDAGIIKGLYAVTDTILACADTFLSVPCHNRADGFDPMIWAKTYPEVGRAFRSGALTNSGVNAPLFHALDSFIGVVDPDGELNKQQVRRRSILPPSVRRFIESIGDPSFSIRSYIEKGGSSAAVAASFDALLHVYSWFLERHRMRAVGSITIAHASGRQQTAGGARQDETVTFDEHLNNQMDRAIEGRLGSRPRDLTAVVESASLTGRRTTVLTLRFPCPVPARPGDRIQIRREEAADSAGDSRTVTSTSPRHYSVADVEASDDGGGSQRIRLTIAHSGGACDEFLRTSVPGRQLRVKIIPAPDSWPPEDGTAPLLLLAQGAGVGPFLGFLKQRRTALSNNKECRAGNIILILCAKEVDDVPHLQKSISFTQELPLTVHLALSCCKGRMIRGGKEHPYSKRQKVQEVLGGLDDDFKAEISAEKGHIYVCGSVGFGRSVRSALHDLQILDPVRYHEDCFGGVNSSTFTAPHNAVNFSELVRHNKPDDLWMAIGGTVYDLTSFVNRHPGGLKMLMESSGSVADRRFYQIHGGDMNQGTVAHMGQYAIGSLQYDGWLSSDRIEILSQVVACQNVLTNNTSCAPGRTMPFYVICDSLLVTTKSLQSIAIAATAVDEEDQSTTTTQALFGNLERTLKEFKTASWAFLDKTSSSSQLELEVELESAESTIRAGYATHWAELQLLFDHAKDLCLGSQDDDNLKFGVDFQAFLQRYVSWIWDSVQHGITAYKHEKLELEA